MQGKNKDRVICDSRKQENEGLKHEEIIEQNLNKCLNQVMHVYTTGVLYRKWMIGKMKSEM